MFEQSSSRRRVLLPVCHWVGVYPLAAEHHSPQRRMWRTQRSRLLWKHHESLLKSSPLYIHAAFYLGNIKAKKGPKFHSYVSKGFSHQAPPYFHFSRWNHPWATFVALWNCWTNFNTKTDSHSSRWYLRDGAQITAQSRTLTEKFGTSNDNFTFCPSGQMQRVHGDGCSVVCLVSPTFLQPCRENSGLTNTWFDLIQTKAQLEKMWNSSKGYFNFHYVLMAPKQNTCAFPLGSVNVSLLFLSFSCEMNDCLGV